MNGQRSLTLHLRSLAPERTATGQETIVNRLEQLEDRGVIDSYEIEIWGKKIAHDCPLAETDAGKRVRERIETFQTWAEENGVSVERFFPEREIESSITETSQRVTELPVMALAEYEAGELYHLTPNETADGVETVRDRIERLDAPRATSDKEGAVPALD